MSPEVTGVEKTVNGFLRPSLVQSDGGRQTTPRKARFGSIGKAGSWISFTVVIAVWTLVSHFELMTPFLLPAPLTVGTTAVEMIGDGTLFGHAWTSAQRVAIGFALGISVALPLAVFMSVFRVGRVLIEPPLEFLRHIPPLGLIPLLILWFGIGEASKIAVIVLASFFPMFLGTLGGISHCDPKLVEVGRMCGLRRRDNILRIVLPAATPSILIGLRLSFGYCWRALVGAELIASTSGLGHMIVDAEMLARTDIIFVGIFTIGFLGLCLDGLALAAARRFAPWTQGELELGRA